MRADGNRKFRKLIEEATIRSEHVIAGMDGSFIPKSGKATSGLDWFYNGSASRPEKGLEISLIAVVDVEAHPGYSLSVKQTPANLASGKAKAQQQSNRITQEVIEQAQQMLDQLPDKLKSGLQVAPVASDAESSKPAPDIVEAALTKANFDPEQTVMLGDTPYDIQSAGKAAVKVIALRCGGFQDEQLKGAIAITTIPQIYSSGTISLPWLGLSHSLRF